MNFKKETSVNVASGVNYSTAIDNTTWSNINWLIPSSLEYMGKATHTVKCQVSSGIADDYYDVVHSESGIANGVVTAGNNYLNFKGITNFKSSRLYFTDAPPSGDMPVEVILSR